MQSTAHAVDDSPYTQTARPELEPMVSWLTARCGPPKELGPDLGVGWRLGFGWEERGFGAADLGPDEEAPSHRDEAAIAYDVDAGEFVAQVRYLPNAAAGDDPGETTARFGDFEQAVIWMEGWLLTWEKKGLKHRYAAEAVAGAKYAIRAMLESDPAAWLGRLPLEGENGVELFFTDALRAALETMDCPHDLEASKLYPVSTVEVWGADISVANGLEKELVATAVIEYEPENQWHCRLWTRDPETLDDGTTKVSALDGARFWRKLQALASGDGQEIAVLRKAMAETAEIIPAFKALDEVGILAGAGPFTAEGCDSCRPAFTVRAPGQSQPTCEKCGAPMTTLVQTPVERKQP